MKSKGDEMKYNARSYYNAVTYYKKKLSKLRKKNVFLVMPFENEKAFYSLAPLSNALHELGNELNVKIVYKKSKSLEILERVWHTFNALKQGIKNSQTIALKEFIETVNRKAKNKNFERIFFEPDIRINTKENFFEVKGKNLNEKIDFKAEWFKKYREKELKKTSRKIIEQYNVKRNEVFAISFEVIPAKKDLELPLEDYLDNFAIARSFAIEASKKVKNIAFGSGTAKETKLTPMERTSDLLATIAGCEYSKKAKNPIFIKYRKLSRELKLHELEFASAAFSIHGKGYAGKHFFGTTIGYPDLKGKTRWTNVSQMRLKPWWIQQSRLDDRKPSIRLAITETLPIDNYINSCNINYKMLRKKNLFIKGILEKSKTLFIKGNKSIAGYKTDFNIDLIDFRKKGKRSLLLDDGRVNELMDKEIWKKHKAKVGLYGNFPAGECFMTPKKINGIMVSDVVINVDQSYVIPKDKPIVMTFRNGKYKLERAPAFIKRKMIKEWKDARKLIKEFEKNKSLPKSIINEYKRNFINVGEFSINTNPKATLSRYLIETEKMARMMHLAIGSGFEPGTQTLYHWDTVINSVNQEIDVFTVDEKGRKHYIIRKGKMLFKE